MRTIDGDALITFIDNRYDITWKDDYEGGIKDACTDILEEINKMPTIEPEQRWIPFKTRPLTEEEKKIIQNGTAFLIANFQMTDNGYL